ncbi:MAG: xanthine dehydrogenase family protein subunit M [Candidatus Binatia bacterium]
MVPFELAEPASLSEAIGLLDCDDPAVRPIAGGTALMLMMKAGVFQPRRLVSLRGLGGGLADIHIGPGGELRVGALVALSDVERSRAVRGGWPVIGRALWTLSNVRVRNVATVGGHLAHADPHMDLPPVLIALGARVTVAGRAGERTLPVAELSRGYYETALRRDELITALTVPPLGRRRAAYVKCTTRSADDWPALGVAVCLDVEDGMIRSALVAIGAAAETPLRLHGAEQALCGARADGAALRRAGDAAADELTVAGDAHGSADYKKQLARVYVGRAVRAALAADAVREH